MINLLVKASINAYSCIATKLFTNYCVHIFLIFHTIITNFKSDCTDTHVVLINSAGFWAGVQGKGVDLHSFPKNNLGYTVC